MNKQEIAYFIREEIAATLGHPIDSIDENVNFLRIGIPSIQTLKIINKLRQRLGIDINPISMFEYKTIGTFSDYLAECFDEKAI